MPPEPLLRVRGLEAGYGDKPVLHGIDLTVGAAEIVCLLGANGAGKTTTLKTLLGLLRPLRGSIVFDRTDITRAPPAARIRAGIAAVPEGRRLFPRLTIEENLRLGAPAGSGREPWRTGFDRVAALFPLLAERRTQQAGTLSGGEQQMVAMARALMAQPRLLCLDEPSMGLSPLYVEQVFATLCKVNASGVSVLLIEQNTNMALSVATTGYVLEGGIVALHGPAETLRADPAVREAYLGG